MTTGVIIGAFSGDPFGFAMGRFFQLQTVAVAASDVLDELSVAERRAATRAATGGPVPADPVVRRAALLVAERSRDSNVSRWRFNSAVCLSALVLYVVFALTASPWWWIALVVFAGWFVQHLTSRLRVNRRIALLENIFDGP